MILAGQEAEAERQQTQGSPGQIAAETAPQKLKLKEEQRHRLLVGVCLA